MNKDLKRIKEKKKDERKRLRECKHVIKKLNEKTKKKELKGKKGEVFYQNQEIGERKGDNISN